MVGGELLEQGLVAVLAVFLDGFLVVGIRRELGDSQREESYGDWLLNCPIFRSACDFQVRTVQLDDLNSRHVHRCAGRSCSTPVNWPHCSAGLSVLT